MYTTMKHLEEKVVALERFTSTSNSFLPIEYNIYMQKIGHYRDFFFLGWGGADGNRLDESVNINKLFPVNSAMGFLQFRTQGRKNEMCLQWRSP